MNFIRHIHLSYCGVDFSKAVVITDDKYIDMLTEPHIRENEFNALRGKDYNSNVFSEEITRSDNRAGGG